MEVQRPLKPSGHGSIPCSAAKFRKTNMMPLKTECPECGFKNLLYRFFNYARNYRVVQYSCGHCKHKFEEPHNEERG
jgi:DNA-directed RNA polymerase subunit RPC12/RpoP